MPYFDFFYRISIFMKIIKINLLYLFLIFLYIPVFAETILDPGIGFCRSNPAACGLADYNDARQEGIEQCRNNPASCGIYLYSK